MIKYIIGCDNGTTGKYCFMSLKGELLAFNHVPTFKHASWSQPKKVKDKDGKTIIKQAMFNFIDIQTLKDQLNKLVENPDEVICYLERPAVNYHASWSLQTSLSAFAAWYGVIYTLKQLNIKYIIIDSKQWQAGLIPQATGKNNKEYLKTLKPGERNKLLKKAADEFANNIYKDIGKDCDAICIAEYYRRIQVKNQKLDIS